MIAEFLAPNLDFLRQEHVLVQAWKKTSAHIRRHNWYSDTLELDRATVNLPQFLRALRERLGAPTDWTSEPLRIVPAPKSQRWKVDHRTGHWLPSQKGKAGVKLRPLAHVSLADQVAATAIMLCLADRIETLQGDPRASASDPEARKRVVSYGNRLFCDEVNGSLRHRWGSGRLYRSYYQDYRSFLDRPEAVIKAIVLPTGNRVIVVHSDLRQFYDRVRPGLLAQKLDSLAQDGDDGDFYELAKRVLSWQWHKKDSREVSAYAQQAGLDDFSSVALPQGLVAAGFFANLVLVDFDRAVQKGFPKTVAKGPQVKDICRYVDDLRVVLIAEANMSLLQVENEVFNWLKDVLQNHAPGLEPSREKTRAALLDGEERPLVRQSKRMARIQRAVSGGFDAVAGEEILSAVQGLMRSQQRYSQQRTQEQGWVLAPIADVGDATVARFAAARFRSTYRSLRPLLAPDSPPAEGWDVAVEAIAGRSRVARSQEELDDEVRAFALGLIENWVEDPSNVRLLRIGLDLWPDPRILKHVLALLKPFTEKSGKRKAPRRVAWYCLAEVLRAGATETGFVEDDESLPKGIDIEGYRTLLADEAVRLLSLPAASLPWYLKQQALLFLAVHDAKMAPVTRTGSSPETKHYRSLIRFLRGDGRDARGSEFATLAILARHSFCQAEQGVSLGTTGITVHKLEEIGSRDPSFAVELVAEEPALRSKLSARLRDDLCLRPHGTDDGWTTLSDLVLDAKRNGVLRNEPAILDLALNLLENWPSGAHDSPITPNEVQLRFRDEQGAFKRIEKLRVVSSRVSTGESLYLPPSWCPEGDRWKYQLGYLLRFVLAARRDFTKFVRPPSWRMETPMYRSATSHWLQRRYGFFNRQPGFGDDWLPISDWLEQLLSALLWWPGCRALPLFKWVEQGIQEATNRIHGRLEKLEGLRASNGLWLLPLTAPDPKTKTAKRPLRACVVQTVIPSDMDLDADDLTHSSGPHRQQHRNHLSAALAAVERMLDLRETHRGRDGRLDWLILPELSVHPKDVRTHLVPFARAHRTIVLVGLTYEELFAGQPLVNSALWVIPTLSPEGGLQVITRRQGKANLAPIEQSLNAENQRIQGFRPCQWLIGYEWSNRLADNPLWLTSAVCYDATDLALATALRDHSDVFAIPALNRDVGTFDHMALALHYPMFQAVIVVNNGEYGGSNAYTPLKESFRRQVFHLHGQPQASIAFLEIDDIAAFLRRHEDARSQSHDDDNSSPRWKYPPAGMEQSSD